MSPAVCDRGRSYLSIYLFRYLLRATGRYFRRFVSGPWTREALSINTAGGIIYQSDPCRHLAARSDADSDHATKSLDECQVKADTGVLRDRLYHEQPCLEFRGRVKGLWVQI
jgi:hypothetical protein